MSAPTISYRPVCHRNKACILVTFPPHAGWNKRMKDVPGARWSRTLRGWTIPDTAENRSRCGMSGGEQLQHKEKEPGLPSPSLPPAMIAHVPALVINGDNRQQLFLFLQHLQLHGYSGSTIRTYRNEFLQLLQLLGRMPVAQLQPQHLQRYLIYCANQGLRENTIHSRMNALKYYYEQVLHREKMFFDIPRPKKPLLMPKLLNEKELTRLFNALTNRKHKAMLFTAYSAGLRVSEIVNLKLRDIDSGRMQIFVARAKGKKDRYVNLSPVLLDILRQYVKEYLPRPKVYLFESEQSSSAYPARTVQQIFGNAKRRAGIGKEVGIHSLRHSFATHLLEKGVDIRYIKDLLGHFSIKTTERYLHVSRKKLVNILSPFDELYRKEEIDW